MAEQQPVADTMWPLVAPAVAERRARWAAPDADAATGLLDALARDPEQLDFTRRLIDVLFGVDDPFSAALGLREVSQGALPEGMPARERFLLRAGGLASLGLPWAIRPAARRRLLSRLPDAILSGQVPGRLTALTERHRRYAADGRTLLVSLTGDPVFGPDAAQTELSRLVSLAEHPAVKQLAFDPARIVPGATEWTIEADTALAAQRLAPVIQAALAHGVRLIVEPRDLVWATRTPELLARALACPEFDRAEVGARLFADLPESREVYAALHRFARRRVAEGGAPLEVVIGLSDRTASARAAAILSGLPVPVIEDATDRTAQFLRLIEIALQPGRAAVLRPVIASAIPEVLIGTAELATRIGAERLYALQLRCGTDAALAGALAAELQEGAPELRMHLPLVPKHEYGDVAEMLVALLVEAVDPETPDFSAAVQRCADAPAAVSHRTQSREREWDPSERDSALFYRAPDEPATHDTGGLTAAVLGLTRDETGEIALETFSAERRLPVVSRSGFANEPPTDGSGNREWARRLLRAAGGTARDADRADETVALSPADRSPDAAAHAAREAAERWAEQPHEIRAVRLRRAALATAAARDRLVTALATETGAPFIELDGAVNRIIDAARYAGHLADGLRAVRGAEYAAERLVLVVADASAPLAAQATAVLGVLGSGAGALWAAPQSAFRSATACVEEWEAGGLTPGAVRIVAIGDEGTFAALGASPHVDRAVVLGDRSLGRELSRRRPDLRIEGHFGARDSIIIGATAERARAIPDIIDSAFRGTQLAPASSSGVILLSGSGGSARFRRDLADAVRALRVGDTARPGGEDALAFDIGPLPAPPGPRALAALTTLAAGEEWLVAPEALDDAGRLWSPGVKLGVAPGSPFWEDARGLPLIGVSHAALLSDAIAQQNAPGGGTVAGIQSWDRTELLAWLDGAAAATLCVNRPTSGLRIERQPSGGWNDAAMGLPTLVGGAHWLLAQGSWTRRAGTRSDTLHLRGLNPEVVLLIEAAQTDLAYEQFDEVRRAALADQLAWRTRLGRCIDTHGLGIERNAVRTAPVPVQVRLCEHGSLAGLVRVLAAALLVRAPISVSTGVVLPHAVAGVLEAQGIEVSLERDEDWLERLAVSGPWGPGGMRAERVRLIGGDRVRVAEWMGGLDRTALWAEPVTMAGPVELLVFVREQSVSARAERHGFAEFVPGVDELIEEE